MNIVEREYFRMNITAFCSLRLRKLGSKMLSPGETFEAEIQNVSGGGLCFLSDRDLPVSDVLVWQFLIDFPNEEVEAYGQLVWKKNEQDMFLYGVKFVFFDENGQRNLLKRINRIQIRERRRGKVALSN